jgi:fluoroacetyl-CoA thioesterase
VKDTLVVGLKHRAVLDIDDTLTVPRVSPKLVAFGDMPPVFATAFLVGFVEATCIEAIAPHLDDGEHSVGTHVDVSHIAATPTGMSVVAEVELIEVDKRFLVFKVVATDEAGEIGEGIHKRAIISVEKFMSKLEQKQRS